jgi:hypothetical protein
VKMRVRVCTHKKSISLNVVLFNHGLILSYLSWCTPS